MWGNKKMKENLKRATAYVVAGTMMFYAAIVAVLVMYFGGLFPVYVAGRLVIWRKVVRYGMYAICIIAGIAGVALRQYGANYIERRVKKMRRR